MYLKKRVSPTFNRFFCVWEHNSTPFFLFLTPSLYNSWGVKYRYGHPLGPHRKSFQSTEEVFSGQRKWVWWRMDRAEETVRRSRHLKRGLMTDKNCGRNLIPLALRDNKISTLHQEQISTQVKQSPTEAWCYKLYVLFWMSVGAFYRLRLTSEAFIFKSSANAFIELGCELSVPRHIHFTKLSCENTCNGLKIVF